MKEIGLINSEGNEKILIKLANNLKYVVDIQEHPTF